MALETPAEEASPFRAAIAPGLGLREDGSVLRIISQQRYVMTPDFGFKLMVLNERRKVGQNVILAGDTGVGKTEMLRMYAVVINSDSSIVADLQFALRCFLMDELLLTDKRQPVHVSFKKYLRGQPFDLADSTPAGMVKTLLGLSAMNVPAPTPPPAPAQGAPQPQTPPAQGAPQVQPPPAQPPPEKKFLSTVALLFVNFVKGILEKYPLIERTAALQRTLDVPQPEEIPDEDVDEDPAKAPIQAVISNIADLKELAEQFLNARFTDLFHSILMHQRIDPAQFRQRVQDIEAAANRVRAMTEKASVVAFVDEFNTSSILGMVKEVFMDHALDGRPLPNNIFWVAAMNRPEAKHEEAIKPREDKRQKQRESKQRRGAQDKKIRKEEADSNYTGVADGRDGAFSVRPPPVSMDELVLDFARLDERQESAFLRVFFALKKRRRLDLDEVGGRGDDWQEELEIRESEWEAQLCEFILFGQKFVREAKIFRMHISIRDMMRAVKLYYFFRRKKSELLGSLPKGVTDRGNYRHWQALIMAVSMAYYFRLRVKSADEKRSKANDRDSFANEIVTMLLASQDRYQLDRGCPHQLAADFKQTLRQLMMVRAERVSFRRIELTPIWETAPLPKYNHPPRHRLHRFSFGEPVLCSYLCGCKDSSYRCRTSWVLENSELHHRH